MRTALVSLVACLGVGSVASAQFGGGGYGGMAGNGAKKQWIAALSPFEGEAVKGVARLDYLVIDYELGTLTIPADKIRTIRIFGELPPAQKGVRMGMPWFEGEIETTTGKTLRGSIQDFQVAMQIDLGSLVIRPGKIKELKLLGPGDDGKPPEDPPADLPDLPPPPPRL